MSNRIKDKIHSSFNTDQLEHALFHNWQYGLRFELNNGGSHVEMFTCSYDRARELLENTFKSSEEIYILLRFYDYSSDKNRQKIPKQLRRLKRCGFQLPEQYLVNKSSHIRYSGEEECQERHYEYLLLTEINSSSYLAILWAICSNELGIQPSAGIKGYFIDFQKQIIAHPYDDRGMDIVAIRKDTISFLYRDYYSWLLDCDLAKMNKTFS